MSSITERAMLARVSVSQFTGRKHDKAVSQEVAAAHGTTVDAGRYNKVLIAKEALAKISTAAGAVRTFHYKNTLPWKDDGARILASVNYWQYCDGLRALQADFEAAVAEFLANYDAYVADSRIRLNGLFNEDDYPSAKEVRRRFKFDFSADPMPTAADFRVDLGDAAVAAIRADIEARTNAAIADAVKDTWARVHDVVAKMAERLRGYDGTRTGSFKDSLVENIRDLVELLPRLNITGDAELDAIARRMDAELCRHDAETLRIDEAVRTETADAAQRMLDDMAAYFGEEVQLAA